MIFIDSNIPMYIVGAAHPLKAEAKRMLEVLVTKRERLVTDAEVLQEILHRFTSIHRPEAFQPAFDAILPVVDEVYPVELEDVQSAKSILASATDISARDAIHVAIMKRRGIREILSFDEDFDGQPGISRLPR